MEASWKWPVKSASFSPDGKKVVAALNGQATIFELENNSCVHLIGHRHIVNNAQFSPDGSQIVTASYDNTAKVWNSETGDLLMTEILSEEVNDASFSPDGKRIVIAFQGGILVRDITDDKSYIPLEGDNISPYFASFSSDGKMIVAACNTSDTLFDEVILWDAVKGNRIRTITGHKERVNSAFFTRDGTKLVTASMDGTTKLWDVVTGDCLDTIPNIHGLTIIGCDLRELHPESELSEEERELLRRYGAIFE